MNMNQCLLNTGFVSLSLRKNQQCRTKRTQNILLSTSIKLLLGWDESEIETLLSSHVDNRLTGRALLNPHISIKPKEQHQMHTFG